MTPHQNLYFSRIWFKSVVFGLQSLVSKVYNLGYGSKMCSHNRNVYLKFNLTDRCSKMKMSPHENLVFSKSPLKSVVFGLQSLVGEVYSLGYESKMCWRYLYMYLKFNQPDRYCNVKTAPHQNMCFSRFPFKIVVFGIRSFVSEGYSFGYGSKMSSHNRYMYQNFNLTDRCSNVTMSPHENLVFS